LPSIDGPPLRRNWYVLQRSACGSSKVKCRLADPRKSAHEQNTIQFDWMSLWTHLWEHGSLPRDTSNTSTIAQAKPSFIDSLITLIGDTLKATFHHSTLRAQCGIASRQKLTQLK
jgi:hypothetical protein